MLQELIEKNLVSVYDRANDWEDAVTKSGYSLREAGYIEDSYIKEIVDNVKEHGPYIVLIPGVAMPHATVGAPGVLKTGMALTIFKESVHFEEEEAQLFFTICTNDNEEHFANMMRLMEFLGDEQRVEQLKKIASIADLKQLI